MTTEQCRRDVDDLIDYARKKVLFGQDVHEPRWKPNIPRPPMDRAPILCLGCGGISGPSQWRWHEVQFETDVRIREGQRSWNVIGHRWERKYDRCEMCRVAKMVKP